MRVPVISLLSATLILSTLMLAQGKDIPARTEDGREVTLRSDGTWTFVNKSSSSQTSRSKSEAESRFSKEKKVKLEAPHGKFVLWYDPKQWKAGERDGNKIMMESSDGKAYALILAEGLAAPKNTLRKIALNHAMKLDPDTTVLSEEKRVVNGREVICLQFRAKLQGIQFRYYGYYYGGTSGNIQVLAFTTDETFDSVKDKLTDFLNGFEAFDDALPDASRYETIRVNGARMSVTYDSEIWKITKRQGEKIYFENADGNGWAIIVPELTPMSADSLLQAALSNAKNADPDAKVISREKRTVHGQEVWCQKIAAHVSGMDWIYYSYDYTGPTGTIQVITYTTAKIFDEKEAELRQLLNSLEVDKALSMEPKR